MAELHLRPQSDCIADLCGRIVEIYSLYNNRTFKVNIRCRQYAIFIHSNVIRLIYGCKIIECSSIGLMVKSVLGSVICESQIMWSYYSSERNDMHTDQYQQCCKLIDKLMRVYQHSICCMQLC